MYYMAYVATYGAADLVNIIFDIIGGIGAELATNNAALGGLVLLGVVIAMFAWIMKGSQKVTSPFK